MGCSASRTSTFLSNSPEDPPSFSASHSSSSSPQVRRALSLPTPLVHHPPIKKGDTHHLVSLTSTTYGSLLLLNHPKQNPSVNGQDCADQTCKTHQKTQVPTDPQEFLSPDSVINTWELMDGLDDFDFDSYEYVKPVENPNSAKPSSCRDAEFDGSVKKLSDSYVIVKSPEKNSGSSSPSKPLWKHLSEESMLAKLDPNVALSYRRALSSRQLGGSNNPKIVTSTRSFTLNSSPTDNWFSLSEKIVENKIVLYFTSLRGIRKTYEDCCAVRMIFRGFRVAVDERDISMDSEYRKELQSALGGKMVSLPQVFIRGKCVGGAEEVKQLNEDGELAQLLEGFPVRDPGLVCERCGDARFLPCANCSGSRKVFEEEEGRLRRCLDCNENGLIRCPGCC